MSQRQIIFVGGIHGVGKSTACEKVCSALGLQYLSASNLIRQAKENLHISAPAWSGDKRVHRVDHNQELLLRGLEKAIVPDSKYLLDGHFTLLNQDGEIEEIPSAVYRKISLIRLIVLEDDAAHILERRKNRDGNVSSLDLRQIQEHQQREIFHAEKISEELKIPFDRINSKDLARTVCDAFRLLGKYLSRSEENGE